MDYKLKALKQFINLPENISILRLKDLYVYNVRLGFSNKFDVNKIYEKLNIILDKTLFEYGYYAITWKDGAEVQVYNREMAQFYIKQCHVDIGDIILKRLELLINQYILRP